MCVCGGGVKGCGKPQEQLPKYLAYLVPKPNLQSVEDCVLRRSDSVALTFNSPGIEDWQSRRKAEDTGPTLGVTPFQSAHLLAPLASEPPVANSSPSETISGPHSY